MFLQRLRITRHIGSRALRGDLSAVAHSAIDPIQPGLSRDLRGLFKVEVQLLVDFAENGQLWRESHRGPNGGRPCRVRGLRS